MKQDLKKAKAIFELCQQFDEVHSVESTKFEFFQERELDDQTEGVENVIAKSHKNCKEYGVDEMSF